MNYSRLQALGLLLLVSLLFASCKQDPPVEDFEQLTGTWVRVLSNNPANDGMFVSISNGEGTITQKANSGFSVGDVKWSSVEAVGEGEFIHQELGSDYNYYSASMQLDGDTLRISVEAAGAGNQQKWVKESAYTSGSTQITTDLEDTWIRVVSNNPANDGMAVTVTGTIGTVSANPRNTFTIGTVKWKDISWAGMNRFAYSELGSDGNYYTSRMSLEGDTLYLTIDYSGAGNQQKWVRESAFTGSTDQTVMLDCSGILTATTWSNGDAAVDYIVPSGCVIDITATLTIEEGTVIHVEENAGFGIYDNGKIVAVGTQANPITIAGTESLDGWWRGIHIESQLGNKLEHVNISDAGKNYVYCCNEPASVFVKSGASIALSHVSITNGEATGLLIRKDVDVSQFEAVTINTHQSYPMTIGIDIAKDLDGLGSDYTGNDLDFVRIYHTASSKENEIKKLNVPYSVEGKVFNITHQLDIEAGAELVFDQEAGFGVFDADGALSINGTADEPVILRGKQAAKGYWRGIHVETNNLNNKIEYAQISDAGSNYVFCCNIVASLFLKEGKLKLLNTTISNGEEYGIYTGKDFAFEDYKNNTVTTHKRSPLYIPVEEVGRLDSTDSDYTGNDDDYVRIYNSQATIDVEWHQTNVPYLVETVLDLVEPVEIHKGTEIVFEEDGGLGIYDNGTFYVSGRSGEEVVFRGLNDVTGYWRGIHLETNSGSNIMKHAEIANAGRTYIYCCNDKAGFLLKGGQMTIENSDFTKSGGCGITVKSGGTLIENGSNTFADNTDGNICI